MRACRNSSVRVFAMCLRSRGLLCRKITSQASSRDELTFDFGHLGKLFFVSRGGGHLARAYGCTYTFVYLVMYLPMCNAILKIHVLAFVYVYDVGGRGKERKRERERQQNKDRLGHFDLANFSSHSSETTQ